MNRVKEIATDTNRRFCVNSNCGRVDLNIPKNEKGHELDITIKFYNQSERISKTKQILFTANSIV